MSFSSRTDSQPFSQCRVEPLEGSIYAPSVEAVGAVMLLVGHGTVGLGALKSV
jgi:hypothetical protein